MAGEEAQRTVAWGQIRLSTSKRADQEMGWEASQIGDAHRHTLMLDLMQHRLTLETIAECGWVKPWHTSLQAHKQMEEKENTCHNVFKYWAIFTDIVTYLYNIAFC